MQNVISYDFEWPMYKVNILKGTYTVPFNIVAQTSNKELESFCMSKWPQLMFDHPYTMSELAQFVKMQAFLRNELNKNNKIFNDGLYIYFDEHGWFNNIKKIDNIFDIKFDRVDCKMWNDKVPHLQVHGFLTADVNKTIETFDKKNFIKFEKYSTALLSEKFYVKFYQSLPLLYTFSFSNMVNDLILKKITDLIDNNKSNIYKQIKKNYKVDKIEQYKKKVERLDVNKFQVTFANFTDVLKLRVKNNKIETAAAIYFTAKTFQNSRQKKLLQKNLKHLTYQQLVDLEKLARKK